MGRVYHLQAQEREGILRRLSQTLGERADVAFAYAYGSFLQQDRFRDIDVAVWTTAEASARIDVELGTALSRALAHPIDVRVVNEAPVAFLFHVVRGRLLAVRDERLLADVIERTARVYHDLAPLVRQATREAFTA